MEDRFWRARSTFCPPDLTRFFRRLIHLLGPLFWCYSNTWRRVDRRSQGLHLAVGFWTCSFSAILISAVVHFLGPYFGCYSNTWRTVDRRSLGSASCPPLGWGRTHSNPPDSHCHIPYVGLILATSNPSFQPATLYSLDKFGICSSIIFLEPKSSMILTEWTWMMTENEQVRNPAVPVTSRAGASGFDTGLEKSRSGPHDKRSIRLQVLE